MTRVMPATFAYDTSYAGEALPVIRAEFRRFSGVAGLALDEVIADTGADTSALPWADCQTLQLDPTQGVPGLMSGVAGGSATTLGFLAWVQLDGNEYQCQLHADFWFIRESRVLFLKKRTCSRLIGLYQTPPERKKHVHQP